MSDEKNQTVADDDGIPLGLGMALAQNTRAMRTFASMSEEQRKQVIEGAHHVNSKAEMRAYVSKLC